LREYKAQESEPLYLSDFITFVEAHQAASIKILNTSPYQEASEAVQLMTAFKSKGMEFGAVFVLAVSDEVWGSKARTQSARLTLPQNLQFIRYAGATDDERLRLFYVAITRAKTHLYLVNYAADYAGKGMTRLKYLEEITNPEGVHSQYLPPGAQAVLPVEDGLPLPATELTAYWQQRHETALSHKDLQALLQERLAHFQLSPTHVGMFVDLINAGPAAFFMNVILRFPGAPLPQGEFGNAMHETLEWIHSYYRREGHVPHIDKVLEAFDIRMKAKRLTPQQTEQLCDRGHIALEAYLVQRQHTIHATDESEYNFRNEGVFVGPAHMSGKIDKLIIDKQAKTITIVDYKTGKHFLRWQNDPKLHKYQIQLYLYKMLVEGSHQYADYTVTDAYLEFVEPDEEGNIQELHVTFDDAESRRLRDLVAAIWQRIQQVKLPDISAYDQTYAGVLAFEQDLIHNTTITDTVPTVVE
jgi:DNA helicase-2/ATP-dependent DNA helicase PcrA